MEHKVSTEGRKDYEKTGWERGRGWKLGEEEREKEKEKENESK